MKIEVTQECIDTGEKGHIRRCPLALALRPFYQYVYVGGSFVYLDGESYYFPDGIRKWVRKFDESNKPYGPFVFDTNELERV